VTASLEHLAHRLRSVDPCSTLIICIGNDLKGDDAAGPLLYEALRGRIKTPLFNAAAVPENYIQTVIRRAPRTLILVDAADFNAPPGAVAILDPADLRNSTPSTHVGSPAMFINVIRGRIPVEVLFIGIQPKSTGFAEPPCSEVVAAVGSLADFFVAELGFTDVSEDGPASGVPGGGPVRCVENPAVRPCP